MRIKSWLQIILWLLFIAGSIIVALAPKDLLAISIDIVGTPPLRGLTWEDGWARSGGESIRVMAIIGAFIAAVMVHAILNMEPLPLARKRPAGNPELLLFVIVVIVCIGVNFTAGLAWWDPSQPFYIGAMFWPWFVSVVFMGIWPLLAAKLFKLDLKDDYTHRTGNLNHGVILGIALAAGYGLVSTIWHCYQLMVFEEYFYFFVIKLPVVGCTTFFIYGYALKLLSRFGTIPALLLTGALLGLLAPWHTVGFALAFGAFGVVFAELAWPNAYMLPRRLYACA